ncbi:hypothetical protein EB796_017441 [Bugula neritina]|uniref:Uncharacterized protein n=1 Tax=Bugula neritina TaxID=10212 RepID=A0A7J7JF52_BUGNE|nr:hypothetical protein EB796_017441 [Bugula neritina]
MSFHYRKLHKNVNSQSVTSITLVQVEKQTAQPQQIEPRNSSELQIEYIDLSGCKKPSYLEGYKANCWIACVGSKASCEHERYGNRLTVSSAAQFIGFMATPQTVFYLQLRNPSDRKSVQEI